MPLKMAALSAPRQQLGLGLRLPATQPVSAEGGLSTEAARVAQDRAASGVISTRNLTRVREQLICLGRRQGEHSRCVDVAGKASPAAQ